MKFSPFRNSKVFQLRIFLGGFNMDLIFLLAILAVEKAKELVLEPPIAIVSTPPKQPEICVGGS